MPKETVRRKVHELIELTWPVRHERGVFFTRAAYQQLAPVPDAMNNLAVRNFELVCRLIQRNAAEGSE